MSHRSHGSLRRLIALGLTALAGGCALLDLQGGGGLTIRISRPAVVVCSDRATGWGLLTHPQLDAVGPDRLFLKYYMGGDEQESAHPALAGMGPACSGDGGLTWQIGPTTNPSGLAAYAGFGGSVVPRADGVRLLYPAGIRNSRDPLTVRVTVTGVASNGQKLFTAPGQFRLPQDPMPGLKLAPRGVLQRDGGQLLSAWTYFPGDRLCRIVLFRSADGGINYDYVSTIAAERDAPWGREGPDEHSLLELADGELLCVARTGSSGGQSQQARADAMLSSRSRDGGLTWQHAMLPVSGVAPKLCAMSHGVVVLAYGRPGNCLRFSLDGGHTWQQEKAISAINDLTSGYCDMAEVSPGRLLVVYDHINFYPQRIWLWEPPPRQNAIKCAFVDVIRPAVPTE